jgi:hypothetical protein
VTEEGRLGEDLEVQERRRRLEGDGRQLLEAVQAARRVDVAQRDGEHQPPGHRREPTPQALPALDRPAADDMIAVIDGLEERLQMLRGPRLRGRRDQDEREMGVAKADGEGVVQPLPRGPDDTGLHRPADRHQVRGQGLDDGCGAVGRQVGEQDDSDAGVGQRVALEVAEEGIVEFLARGHSGSRRR